MTTALVLEPKLTRYVPLLLFLLLGLLQQLQIHGDRVRQISDVRACQ
jgi:hypothetical protein